MGPKAHQMIRRVFNFSSALSLLACILMLVLWSLSFHRHDAVFRACVWNISAEGAGFAAVFAGSFDGGAYLLSTNDPSDIPEIDWPPIRDGAYYGHTVAVPVAEDERVFRLEALGWERWGLRRYHLIFGGSGFHDYLFVPYYYLILLAAMLPLVWLINRAGCRYLRRCHARTAGQNPSTGRRSGAEALRRSPARVRQIRCRRRR